MRLVHCTAFLWVMIFPAWVKSGLLYAAQAPTALVAKVVDDEGDVDEDGDPVAFTPQRAGGIIDPIKPAVLSQPVPSQVPTANALNTSITQNQTNPTAQNTAPASSNSGATIPPVSSPALPFNPSTPNTPAPSTPVSSTPTPSVPPNSQPQAQSAPQFVPTSDVNSNTSASPSKKESTLDKLSGLQTAKDPKGVIDQVKKLFKNDDDKDNSSASSGRYVSTNATNNATNNASNNTSPPLTSPSLTSPPLTSPPLTSPPLTSPPLTPLSSSQNQQDSGNQNSAQALAIKNDQNISFEKSNDKSKTSSRKRKRDDHEDMWGVEEPAIIIETDRHTGQALIGIM